MQKALLADILVNLHGLKFELDSMPAAVVLQVINKAVSDLRKFESEYLFASDPEMSEFLSDMGFLPLPG